MSWSVPYRLKFRHWYMGNAQKMGGNLCSWVLTLSYMALGKMLILNVSVFSYELSVNAMLEAPSTVKINL